MTAAQNNQVDVQRMQAALKIARDYIDGLEDTLEDGTGIEMVEMIDEVLGKKPGKPTLIITQCSQCTGDVRQVQEIFFGVYIDSGGDYANLKLDCGHTKQIKFGI